MPNDGSNPSSPADETRQPVDELLPIVYDRLRELAGRYLTPQPGGHTLQPTALVHEAYMKIQGSDPSRALSRSHFLATAALAMRQILVDHARGKGRRKRGSGWERITLADVVRPERGIDIIALDDAMERLARLDARKSRIVECRFFAGMNVDEVADVIDVSASTVEREWRLARAWLGAEMRDAPSDEDTT